MVTQEEIKAFLEGNDPEEHIVAIEYDYVTDAIYKIKEIPGQGKIIKKDTFTAFAWVEVPLVSLLFFHPTGQHHHL